VADDEVGSRHGSGTEDAGAADGGDGQRGEAVEDEGGHGGGVPTRPADLGDAVVVAGDGDLGQVLLPEIEQRPEVGGSQPDGQRVPSKRTPGGFERVGIHFPVCGSAECTDRGDHLAGQRRIGRQQRVDEGHAGGVLPLDIDVHVESSNSGDGAKSRPLPTVINTGCYHRIRVSDLPAFCPLNRFKRPLGCANCSF
jgi:hypothetical protein